MDSSQTQVNVQFFEKWVYILNVHMFLDVVNVFTGWILHQTYIEIIPYATPLGNSDEILKISRGIYFAKNYGGGWRECLLGEN